VAFSGCWNILNSIKSAAQSGEEVYLVEEDVLVYPHFFSWHRSQTAVASCGRRDKGMEAYPPLRGLYSNPGACLRRPLLDALVPHINEDYFKDTKAYCERKFPPMDVTSTLDDGLIRRVIRGMGESVAYPDSPVCVHAGFRYYGRLDIYSNREPDLERRIERARQIIANPASQDRYARDWEPYL
jgi:hypothetical protein